jgi:hypothetical protein
MGSQYLGLALIAVALLGLQHLARPASAALVLLVPAAVVAVLDDACAVANAAVMNFVGPNHR